jgi:anti-sigma factor RsiW
VLTCRACLELLGSLDDPARPRHPEARSHLARCSDCAAYAASLRSTIRAVRAAYREDPVEGPAVPEELLLRVLASRRDAVVGLVYFLAGVVVSPLLAVSLRL